MPVLPMMLCSPVCVMLFVLVMMIVAAHQYESRLIHISHRGRAEQEAGSKEEQHPFHRRPRGKNYSIRAVGRID